jgi:hypothetical protein
LGSLRSQQRSSSGHRVSSKPWTKEKRLKVLLPGNLVLCELQVSTQPLNHPDYTEQHGTNKITDCPQYLPLGGISFKAKCWLLLSYCGHSNPGAYYKIRQAAFLFNHHFKTLSTEKGCLLREPSPPSSSSS